METTNIMILAWMVMGIINIAILQWIMILAKTKPDLLLQHYNKGLLYWFALQTIWFMFAFIIIPIYILKFIRSYLINLLLKINNFLNKKSVLSQAGFLFVYFFDTNGLS